MLDKICLNVMENKRIYSSLQQLCEFGFDCYSSFFSYRFLWCFFCCVTHVSSQLLDVLSVALFAGDFHGAVIECFLDFVIRYMHELVLDTVMQDIKERFFLKAKSIH